MGEWRRATDSNRRVRTRTHGCQGTAGDRRPYADQIPFSPRCAATGRSAQVITGWVLVRSCEGDVSPAIMIDYSTPLARLRA